MPPTSRSLRQKCHRYSEDIFIAMMFRILSQRLSVASRKDWFRDLDSNQDTQLQRLMSYRLDDPGTDDRSVPKA
jgi:hypothetical protein